MLSRSLAILATAAVLSAPAFSPARQPFPFTVSATDTALGTVTLAPEGAAIAGLTAESHVLLTDIYLPGGELIDVELYRLSVERRRFGFQVDGAAVGDLTVGLDLSIWRGTVPGEVASQVYLSFSNSGCRGWIQRANDVIHLCPQPNASGDWQNSEAVFVAESTLGRMGMTLGGFCKYDVANGMRGESQVPTQHPGGPGTIAAGVCATRECTVAVETDFQLFQQFADLNALTA